MAKVEKKLDWKEYPDPTPVEIPVEMKRPETMDEKIRRIIREKISHDAHLAGKETIEEASDFDVLDDFEISEPLSPHEMTDMEPEYPEGIVEKLTQESEESTAEKEENTREKEENSEKKEDEEVKEEHK